MLNRTHSIILNATAIRATQVRALLPILLCANLIIVGLVVPVAAQQQTASISLLEEQIAKLEEVDKNEATPPEIKRLNGEFLRERHARLEGLLKKRIAELRQYASTIGNSLTAEEKLNIEKMIQGLEDEVKSTGEKMQGASPPIASTAGDAGVFLKARAASTSTSSQAASTVPSNFERPLNSANSTRAAAASGAPAAPALVQADCYPNAPPALVQAVTAAAQQAVDRNDPEEVTSQFFPILFFATAHAVSVDAVNVDQQHRDLINRIEISRLQAQTKMTEKQIGASARSEGSTSAAEKPGFAEILGFAIEHGAVQKEVNGTTLTLSSSPYMIVQAGQGDTATTYKKYGYLSRVGVSANFNIDNQNNLLASARRNQLGEWSVHARLSPDRSQRSMDAEEIWNKVRDRFAAPEIVLTQDLATTFQTDRELNAKRREIEDRFRTIAFTVPASAVLTSTTLTRDQKVEQIAKLILCQVKTDIFDQVRSNAFKIDAATRDRIINVTLPKFSEAQTAKEAAIKEFEDGLDRLSHKWVMTLAYTNKRQVTSSDYSILKLLYEKKTSEGLNMIANAGFSLYHKPDALVNQKTFRDFAAAFSLEGTAGRSPFLSEGLDQSQITFSFTGRYQRLLENRGIAGKKADIGIAQFKLEIPLFMGMTLPFSVTYANATELIKEDHVRANFGFTLDTDKVLQVLRLTSLK